MSGLRNQPGQLALVVPFEGAAADIQVHGGKVVTPIHHGACGLGPDAWSTFPVLYDGFGNALSWDDRDLKPLGEKHGEFEGELAHHLRDPATVDAA